MLSETYNTICYYMPNICCYYYYNVIMIIMTYIWQKSKVQYTHTLLIIYIVYQYRV